MISAYLLAAASVAEGYAEEYDITDDSWSGDGEFYPDILPEGLTNDDMTEEAYESGVEESLIKFALAPDTQTPTPDISVLSEFFNTKYILCNGSYYAEPFYRTNGYYRKDGEKGMTTSTTGKPVGQTDLRFFIPIKRISGYHFLKFKGKTIQNNGLNHGADFNDVSCGVAYVDSNGVMQTVFRNLEKSVEDWTEYSVGISTLPYVDYIVLLGADGSPAYKDFKFTR